MADESELIGQDEIEQLLKQSGAVQNAPAGEPPAAPPTGGHAPGPSTGRSGATPAASNPSAAGAEGQGSAPGGTTQASGSAAARGQRPPQAAAQGGPASAAATADPALEEDASIAAADLELLLQQAQAALASVDAPVEEHVPGLSPYQFEEFTGAAASRDSATLDLLRDVDLDLRIELGRTNMYLEDVLKLRKGAVVPLDKLAGDPVDIYVNGRLIARGEVLVLNDNFCVRIAELVASDNPATV